ncbi:MAG: hypothetical protein KIT33_10425 [Candidatus Kapabacteria bacterium]|nr:hypothetical protein [Ignavibacteriota bacterium]MCW5885374.1 hypothetical protein [Candidatus Kapabacteria bacterium]
MAQSVVCKWDDMEIDSILYSFQNEIIRISYQLEILDTENESNKYQELISYKKIIESSMERILSQLRQMKFKTFCDLQRHYRFLKLTHFKYSKKVQESVNVLPVFDNDETETPFGDIDFESILTPDNEEDIQIINSIGREKLMKILKENHIGIRG